MKKLQFNEIFSQLLKCEKYFSISWNKFSWKDIIYHVVVNNSNSIKTVWVCNSGIVLTRAVICFLDGTRHSQKRTHQPPVNIQLDWSWGLCSLDTYNSLCLQAARPWHATATFFDYRAWSQIVVFGLSRDDE